MVAEHADVLLDPIRIGAERAGRTLDDIDLQVNTQLAVSDDVDALIAKYRPAMAFTLGGMGSAKTNFYNSAFSRAGFDDIGADVQRLWTEGDKPAAVAAVPDEMVLSAYSIGTTDMVADRVRQLEAAGIDALRLGPIGATAAEQIAHLEMAVDLVRNATATPPTPAG